MPGPRIEPRSTTYKADVVTGHRDNQYTTPPPTAAIMMNQTHADIHQLVSKPVGISPVYAIRHFKQSMGGVVYQNVGEMHIYTGSDQIIGGGPCCCTSLISMCNIRHICIVPCHGERIVPNTCQPSGDRSPMYCIRMLPQSCQ